MSGTIQIYFCNGFKPKNFPRSDIYIDDVIEIILKALKFKPICRPLYGLRDSKTLLWLSLSTKLSSVPQDTQCQFRLRYMLGSHERLKKVDLKSHEYFYYQVCDDFRKGLLPEHTKHKDYCLGLVATDIIHHLVVNNEKSIQNIELKSFFPKSVYTANYARNVKTTVAGLLESNKQIFFDRGPGYIRDQFFEKVEEAKTPCCTEKYLLEVDEGHGLQHVEIVIDPFHSEYPGLYHQISKKKYHHLCRIEEIAFISIRKDNFNVELSRNNGVPCYLRLPSIPALESFVGCLTGHYRLMKCWTFDLCRELPTPSLVYLKSNRCHGFVGSEFVLRKLKRRGGSENGVGLLQQSSDEWNTFILTILKSSTGPTSEHVIVQTDEKVSFKDSDVFYATLTALVREVIKSHKEEYGLKHILPPSDLDNCPELLLCSDKTQKENSQKVSVPEILSMDEFVLNPQSISSLKGRFSKVYKVFWSRRDNKEVAVKVPKLQLSEYDLFLETFNKFLFINGDCVIKIFGLTLKPISLVMESLPLGPLDSYLKDNSSTIRLVDLVEAASCLAMALWDMSAKGISHHNIRCRKIMVSEHTKSLFKIKLGPPTRLNYDIRDIHWIPREHVQHPSSAIADPLCDVWAFGVTLWEIFSLGQRPLPNADLEELSVLYLRGFTLPRPELCPKDLYQIMLGCWHMDPAARKRPQVIMRDIKQIFYQVFNSRHNDDASSDTTVYETLNINYASLDIGEMERDEQDGVTISDQFSVSTQTTTLAQSDGSMAEVTLAQIVDFPFVSMDIMAPNVSSEFVSMPPTTTCKELTLEEHLRMPTSSWYDPTETPFFNQELELDNCKVEVLDPKPVGEGNYGCVFRGRMMHADGRVWSVALKSLKAVANYQEFKKEMNIMKSLRHECIVHLHGLCETENNGTQHKYMVMDYYPLGSLRDYVRLNKNNLKLTSDDLLIRLAQGIAKGMDYLESCKIVHRDLAARNVLVASETTVKITDFGLAQKPNSGNYYLFHTNRELPIPWYAIECLKYCRASHKSDVWSYGVTCWEVFTRGKVPSLPENGKDLLEALEKGIRLRCEPPCSTDIYEMLIYPCWEEASSARPSFSAILSIITELQDLLKM